MRAWEVTPGTAPVVATAIHAGHHVRADLAGQLRATPGERQREEDPGTDLFLDHLRGLSSRGSWAWAPPDSTPARIPRRVLPSTVAVRRSRFEVELNRSRDGAVLRTPEQTWGLEVWRRVPDADQQRASLALHDGFYADVEGLLERLYADTGRFVVLDLHSYCYRRGGPGAPADPADANPEINIGTGSIEHPRWRPLVERFMADLRAADDGEPPLDVRENVKFAGGFFPQWVNHRFGERGCAIAVELKKTYIDEWTGTLAGAPLRRLQRALHATLPGLVEELGRP